MSYTSFLPLFHNQLGVPSVPAVGRCAANNCIYCFMAGHCIRYRATPPQGRTGSQGQSRQQAHNLYNKLTLAITITLTDTGGAVLNLLLGYRKFKTKTGPNPNLWPCTFCSDRSGSKFIDNYIFSVPAVCGIPQ